MHYYQFNIGDYRKDTVHLSRLEHSIYRDLIDWCYLEETPIPKETQSVIRRLRLETQSEFDALQNVLNDFFVLQDDGYHQSRIDIEIADYHSQCDKNRKNGIKGGRPKLNKTQSVISGMPVGCQVDATANPNHKPLTTNHKPITKSVAAPNGFAEFYAAYPKKVGRPAAEKAFKKVSQHLPDLLADISRRLSAGEWLMEKSQFIPNPTTYLNQRRWEDVVEPAANPWAGAI